MHLTKLRKAARGMDCMIRLPSCNFNPETTCLAHYRLSGTCGMGQKPHDLLASFSCSNCHSVCDGREHLEGWTKDMVRLAHAEGCLRTINELIKRGLIILT